MSKPNRPSYAEMIDLPDDPVEAPAIPVQAVEAEQPKPAAVSVVGPSQDRGGVAPKDGTPTAYRPKMPVTEAHRRAHRAIANHVPATAKASTETPKPARTKAASSVPSRREAARLRRLEPKPEPADYAQRSLYAREETFQRFRALAFENGKAAQELYREGLFLVLQKYGQADGLTLEDM